MNVPQLPARISGGLTISVSVLPDAISGIWRVNIQISPDAPTGGTQMSLTAGGVSVRDENLVVWVQ
jgi:hypothetical protein